MKVNLKKLGYALFHKSFVKITEYNKDKLENKTYIFGPNHTSDLDGPVLWSSNQNMKIMAKKECFENKLMDRFLTSIDVMKVDRDAHNGSAMMEAIKYLKKNDEEKILLNEYIEKQSYIASIDCEKKFIDGYKIASKLIIAGIK